MPLGYPMPDQTYLPGEMDGVAPGLSRIVWLEGGWTIEASGTGIPTSQDLTALLGTLQPLRVLTSSASHTASCAGGGQL